MSRQKRCQKNLIRARERQCIKKKIIKTMLIKIINSHSINRPEITFSKPAVDYILKIST